MRIGPNPNWMIGERFGRWVVVAFHGRYRGTKYLHVVCDCGRQNVIQQKCLTRGESESCGCLAREIAAKQMLKHGHARHGAGRSQITVEYKTWSSMIRRCRKIGCPEWPDYGGRGIRVCDRWLKFENFLADMGPKPAGLTLERKDNNGNYEPGNCVWATHLEQMRNRRCSIYLEVNGIRLPLIEWAKRVGVRYETLFVRFKNGWSPDRILSAPDQRYLRKRNP